MDRRDLGYQVARNLHYFMESEGLTPSMLADELGVSRGAVCMWLHNQRLPSLTIMVALAKRFRTSLDSLVK